MVASHGARRGSRERVGVFPARDDAPAPNPVDLLAGGMAAGGTLVATRFLLPATVRVVDEERREIEVCATSEAVDAHGTIFDYDASKDAFTRWLGNVREMHERRAVGTRIALRFDDAERRVYVRVRVSKGAQDTWEKVLDGTLRGASIGAANVTWSRQARGGKAVPIATRYDLAELSLVDAPSNPDTLGFTFVRDGVTLDDALDPLDIQATQASAPALTDSTAGKADSEGAERGTVDMNDPQSPQSPRIIEPAGSLQSDDVAVAIAQAALARGRQALASTSSQQNSAQNPQGGDDAPAHIPQGATGAEQRTGGSAHTPVREGLSDRDARLAAHGVPVPVTRSTTVEEPGAMYDGDGDHDGGEMAHEPSALAHEAHEHSHTGGYDDAHEHGIANGGAHMHEDGTSHVHPHLHSHDHHNHHADASRAAEGHSHGHVHHHAHGHYYRVADGAAVDARMATGEQARMREYVSAAAFAAAGGIEGHALTAEQYRVAAGVESRLEHEAAQLASRAQGPYSRNPYGAADIGTPAEAAVPPELTHDDLRDGRVRQLDRDGQPMATPPAPSAQGGTDDQSAAPTGYMELTDGRSYGLLGRAAMTPGTHGGIAAMVEAATARAIQAATQPLAQRLAALESQPLPGGPAFNGIAAAPTPVEKRSALTPGGSAGTLAAAGRTLEERIADLRDVASRVTEPAAQIELATAIILLEQEARGQASGALAMPLAGNGAMPRRPRQRW